MSERIVAAAVQTSSGLVLSVPPPQRHHHIIRQVKGGYSQQWAQGFLTSDGSFVGRKEAKKIAVAAYFHVGHQPSDKWKYQVTVQKRQIVVHVPEEKRDG